MGDQCDGAALVAQCEDFPCQMLGAMRIETRHRLVEHEERPAIGDGEGGKGEPALLALRELERMIVHKLREAPRGERCRNARGLLVCA